MFPGRDRINPMTTRQLNRVCHMAAELEWVSSSCFIAPLNHRTGNALLRRSLP
jgi:integrase/recombinase XerD